MAGTFSLTNSALLYPVAGFDPDADHFGVMLDDHEVGTIYRIGHEWAWSIKLGMMGSGTGRAASRREARVAFRAAWDQRAARLGPQHVARALAVARGRLV
ncbi:MAG: hypothetical protein JWL86_5340 [Rhizobium sp.]|nr:hypothetical protein [Rhizobium sp.]